jgi:hypothetical protein
MKNNIIPNAEPEGEVHHKTDRGDVIDAEFEAKEKTSRGRFQI